MTTSTQQEIIIAEREYSTNANIFMTAGQPRLKMPLSHHPMDSSLIYNNNQIISSFSWENLSPLSIISNNDSSICSISNPNLSTRWIIKANHLLISNPCTRRLNSSKLSKTNSNLWQKKLNNLSFSINKMFSYAKN